MKEPEKVLRIQECCREHNIKQKSLMEVLGITETSLSTSIAKERFTVKDLSLIAEHIGVPITSLFKDSRPVFLATVYEAGNTFTFSSKDALREWLSGGE